jgi:hypothetical protein
MRPGVTHQLRGPRGLVNFTARDCFVTRFARVFETIERDDYILGRIEVLTHVNGRTNERFVSEWRWDEAGENCDIQALCSWFNIQRSDGTVTGKVEETPMISNGYFPRKYYVCSVPMPILDEEKSLRLSESTTDQLNLFLNLLEK